MASMFVVKNTILRVSKAGLPQLSPSLYHRKVSRVCLTSASKFNENRYPGGDEDAKAAERMREARQVYENDKEAEEVERKYQDMKQSARETTQNMKDKARETSQQAGEAMQEAKDRAKESASRASETMYETKEMAKDKMKDGADRAGETMHDAKEKTKDTMGWTAEKTKEGAGKAAEAVQNVGEKAKETAKGAWETAKDATRKVKETIVGVDEDEYKTRPEDFMEDHLPKRPPGSDVRDKGVHRGSP